MALWKAKRGSLNKDLEFRSRHCGRQRGGSLNKELGFRPAERQRARTKKIKSWSLHRHLKVRQNYTLNRVNLEVKPILSAGPFSLHFPASLHSQMLPLTSATLSIVQVARTCRGVYGGKSLDGANSSRCEDGNFDPGAWRVHRSFTSSLLRPLNRRWSTYAIITQLIPYCNME